MSLHATSLNGPAKTPVHSNVKSVHSAPQCNQKGTINKGGGGGGKGSGCGKKSPCDKSKKKTKSCGGKSKSCGKSKCCGGKKVKFKVTFYDFYGKVINTQSVEKDSNADLPWTSDTDIPEKYKVEGYTFNTWDPYPTGVTQDMECKSKWYDAITGEEVISSSDNGNLVSESSGQKIQDFNDSYLNPGTESTERTIRSVVIPRGKFNLAIDKMIDRSDYVEQLILDAMDTLWDIRQTCYEGPDNNTMFNDTKKCILNIQSCYVFQTRMSFNMDFRQSRLEVEQYIDPKTGEIKTRNIDVRNPDVPDGSAECVYDKINRYTQELLDFIRNGGDESELDEKIRQYSEEIDEDIDFYLENNLIALNEFKESYNIYVDNINSCFPTDPLTKVDIEKI